MMPAAFVCSWQSRELVRGFVLVGKMLRKTLPPLLEQPDWIPPLKSKSLPISFSHTGGWEILNNWESNFSLLNLYS